MQLHVNAYVLSRVPLLVEPPAEFLLLKVVLLQDHLNDSPVTAKQNRTCTAQDPLFKPVLQALQHVCPARCTPELGPFYSKHEELFLLDGCIVWWSKVIVLKKGRRPVLEELY